MDTTSDLDWSGYLTKKAFKTAAKNSWKKRYFVFNASALSLKYYEKPPAAAAVKPKGEFVLDARDLQATATQEHQKPHEIKVLSKGISLFACADSHKDQAALLVRMDAARRARVCGDNGASALLSNGPEALSAGTAGLTSIREPGPKCYTWGVGTMLAIGSNEIQVMSLPRRVPLTKARKIITGPEHAAAISADDSVSVWGSNEFGQLAMPPDFLVAYRPAPLMALAGRRVTAVACGGSHTLALVEASGGGRAGLYAWGTGTVGQLGLGEGTPMAEVPTAVQLPGAAAGAAPNRIFAGLVSSAALTVDGEAFLWGDASLGRLGLPGIRDSTVAGSVPVCVNDAKVWSPQALPISAASLYLAGGSGRPSVTSIALGGAFTLLLVDPGAQEGSSRPPGSVLLVAGSLGIDITKDPYGSSLPSSAFDEAMSAELKSVPRNYSPRLVAPFNSRPCVLAITAGARHAAVIAADDRPGGGGSVPRLYCAGKGWLGADAGSESGSSSGPTSSSRILPDPVCKPEFVRVGGALANEDVLEVACGHSHTVALTADGRLFSWGRGDSGELGLRSLSDQSMPTPVPTLDGHVWSHVGAGSYYTVALTVPATEAVPLSSASVIARLQHQGHQGVGGAAAAPAGPATAISPPTTRPAVDVGAAALSALPTGTGSTDTSHSHGQAVVPAAAGDSADPSPPAAESSPAAPAPAAANEELPDGWDYEYTDDGTIYFIRPDGSTQWDDPRET